MIVKKQNGFTLIELIVVIALMGILATIGFSAYTASMQTGRDNRRKLDLKNIASALQLYYSDSYSYPVQEYIPDKYGIPSILSPTDPSKPTYMKILPHDPKFVNKEDYQYMSTQTGQCYCLSAKLERLNKTDETGGGCSPAAAHKNDPDVNSTYYLLMCP